MPDKRRRSIIWYPVYVEPQYKIPVLVDEVWKNRCPCGLFHKSHIQYAKNRGKRPWPDSWVMEARTGPHMAKIPLLAKRMFGARECTGYLHRHRHVGNFQTYAWGE